MWLPLQPINSTIVQVLGLIDQWKIRRLMVVSLREVCHLWVVVIVINIWVCIMRQVRIVVAPALMVVCCRIMFSVWMVLVRIIDVRVGRVNVLLMVNCCWMVPWVCLLHFSNSIRWLGISWFFQCLLDSIWRTLFCWRASCSLINEDWFFSC